MDGARFQRLASLFEAVRDLPPEEREPLLRDGCGDDDALREEIEALLARHDAVESSGRERLLDAAALLRHEATGEDPDETTAPPPETVGRFRILGEIARGGFGVVLRGEDLAIGRDVALKILPPGTTPAPRLVDLLRTEGRIGGRLQHPGIVPVYELGEIDGSLPFVAMKVVEGRTLSSLLRERPIPSSDRVRFVGIFEQVCQAIAYAHARSVLHRDLKPQNVMIGAFGEVQVMDWGLAATLEVTASDVDSAPEGSVAMGTPAYMAPEQARGESRALDPRSDVFGLGAILCEILTGEPPFVADDAITTLELARAGDTADAIARIRRCGADAEISELAERCLANDPASRPEDARLVAAAVRAYLESLDERARAAELDAASARARASSERTARRMTAALGAIVVLATLIGAGSWLTIQDAARERQRVATSRLQSALLDAERVASDAAGARPETAVRWEAALTTATNAERLIGADVDPDLVRQVHAVRSRAQLRLRDVRFADRLASIGIEDRFLNTYDRSGQIDAYERAVSEHLGADLDAISSDEARDALANFPFREPLVAALDDWALNSAQRTPDAPRNRWLRELADGLDDQPWRRAVRTAVAEIDVEGLIALANDEAADRATAGACVYLAVRLIVRNQEEVAMGLLSRTIERFPGDFETAINLAFVHFASGDRWEALRFASVACAIRPNSALPHAVMANALWGLERRDETIRAARRAVALATDDLSPRAVAGLALFVAGATDEADAIATGYAERVARNHAVYPMYASLLGNVRARQGRFTEAVDAFLDAVQAPLAWPDEPQWYPQLPGMAEGLRAELNTRIERTRESDATVLYLLARLDESTGDLRTALQRYEAVEALRPNTLFTRRKITEIAAQLGGALSSFGAVDRALARLAPSVSEADARRAVFGDAPRLEPVPGIGDFAEGRLAQRAGRYEAAVDHLARAIGADRNAFVAWTRLHEAWVAHAGRARADQEIRALFASGARPARVLDIPPAPPSAVTAPETISNPDAVELRVGGFLAVDPRQRHRATLWQVRDTTADFDRSPTIEVELEPTTPLTIPIAMLAPGRRYAWRAAFLVEGAGPRSEWSAEQTFSTAADAPRPEPFDLAAGFDVDVIADPGDPSDDPFDPPNSFQLVVEGFDGVRTDAPTVQGLPLDRNIGVHRLGAYDRPNARRISAGQRQSIKLPIPAANYAAIRVLAAAANGSATLPVRILYSDGTSDVRPWAILDWFATGIADRVGPASIGMPVWRGMDRMGPDGYEERNAAALFESYLECDPARRATALILMPDAGRFDAATTSVNVFAITGMRVGEPGGR